MREIMMVSIETREDKSSRAVEESTIPSSKDTYFIGDSSLLWRTPGINVRVIVSIKTTKGWPMTMTNKIHNC